MNSEKASSRWVQRFLSSGDVPPAAPALATLCVTTAAVLVCLGLGCIEKTFLLWSLSAAACASVLVPVFTRETGGERRTAGEATKRGHDNARGAFTSMACDSFLTAVVALPSGAVAVRVCAGIGPGGAAAMLMLVLVAGLACRVVCRRYGAPGAVGIALWCALPPLLYYLFIDLLDKEMPMILAAVSPFGAAVALAAGRGFPVVLPAVGISCAALLLLPVSEPGPDVQQVSGKHSEPRAADQSA